MRDSARFGPVLTVLFGLAGVCPSLTSAGPGRDLTFADRVAAQEQIERFYYQHQSGADTPFEEAVPRPVLERKVRTYLAQSAALDDLWRSPVTGPMLRAELERIVASTRLPGRLRQLFQALDDDPHRIQECFARPVLVDRLSRGFFASDERIHGPRPGVLGSTPPSLPPPGWEEWWVAERARFEGREVGTVAGDPGPRAAALLGTPSALASLESATESGCTPDDTWANASLDDPLDGRYLHTMVWTGSVMIVWGGRLRGGPVTDTGGRYDPLTDTWTPTSRTGAPSARWSHTAIWTGTRMIVWGRTGESTGGIYDPIADAWTPTSEVGAPSPRGAHTAVWTGSRMIIWGGADFSPTNTGGSYDPAADTWQPTSTNSAPIPRNWHSAVWTGSEMIVWGGFSGDWNIGYADWTNTGGRYDPEDDEWTPTSLSGAPAERENHAAVWTGSRMIVWGGGTWANDPRSTGGEYDPLSDSWIPTSTLGAPSPRFVPTAVWTGTQMIVWGGDSPVPLGNGSRYNPATGAWSPVTNSNAPSARRDHRAVWTGTQMIVWGGGEIGDGGRYDPVADAWTPTSMGSGPSPRTKHSAVWTGNHLVVWGGFNGSLNLATGGRYDPLTDAWTPTATVLAPPPRANHVAVWSGERMIVWGGGPSAGGRYDPIADAWSPTSTIGIPVASDVWTAVWARSRMLLWNGTSGTRYDPVADTWASIATAGAPGPREGYTLVWTGGRMIVWGGVRGTAPPVFLRDGGRYDPVTDTWAETNWLAPNVASVRADHSAVWTGSRMLVWGGRVGSPTPTLLSTGSAYDPVSDGWEPLGTTGEPLPRRAHAAFWTGGRMIVWGGTTSAAGVRTDTGAVYDPAAATWSSTSTQLVPPPRFELTATWTGGGMIVWGGKTEFDGSRTFLGSGGQYALGQSADFDNDWVTWCAGDCDDAEAATYPGAAETCDGVDNDCDGLSPGETDLDMDGWIACSGDCDDSDPLRNPQAAEACDAVDNDCNGTIDAFATVCGVGACVAAGTCSGGADSCLPGPPSPETCNGIDDDCDGSLPGDEADADGDGPSVCAGDCDDADPATYPQAPETNDGSDNQCTGDPGFGLVDEVEGTAGFTAPGDPASFCWEPQPGATRYEVMRSPRPDLAAGGAWESVAGPCWSDPVAPPSGRRFNYVVRVLAPHAGSWGADSGGEERDGTAGAFHLLDTGADDAGGTAFEAFFLTTPALPSDFLHVALSGGGIEPYEWCAARADFYRDRYLSLAATGGVATSEGWDLWYRLGSAAWAGPLQTFSDGYFGDQCLGAYSWCPEVFLTERNLAVAPDGLGSCEALDLTAGCGDGTWVLTVAVGPDRLTACGF